LQNASNVQTITYSPVVFSVLAICRREEIDENRGFEDNRFERRSSADSSAQSFFVIHDNVLSADNLYFFLTTSAQLQTEKQEKYSSGKSF